MFIRCFAVLMFRYTGQALCLLSLAADQFAHLQICTFAHLHICTFAH
jgi:hypothetical protein